MAGIAQDVEYEILQIVRSLPAKSVVEVRDFAQFLAYKETTLSRSETALTDWDMQAAAIDQEQRAFESQHNELLKQYSGRYIAMIGGQVVDDDLGPRLMLLNAPKKSEQRRGMVLACAGYDRERRD